MSMPASDRPGWRFWFRSGSYLRSPFENCVAKGPLLTASCIHGNSAPWIECLCGIHYFTDAEALFGWPHFRWFLQPEALALLDVRRPEDQQTLNIVRCTPFAVTFGVAEDTFAEDSHRFNPDVRYTPGKSLRAMRYRITGVLAQGVNLDDEHGLRERYRCPIFLGGLSVERCHQVETELTPTVV